MKLTRFHRISIAVFLLIFLVFAGIVVYAAAMMPRMNSESERALNAFLEAAKKRDYQEASNLASPTLKRDLTPQILAQRWKTFEADYGPITQWFPVDDGGFRTNGSGRRICLYPPFVDYTYAVEGAKKNGTIIYLRIVPQNGVWRIDRFSQLNPLPLGLVKSKPRE